jgi:hypothetical protein
MRRPPAVRYFIVARGFGRESMHHAPNRREADKLARQLLLLEDMRCVLVQRIKRQTVAVLHPRRRKS